MLHFVALIPTAGRIARLVTAQSEDACFMRGQVVQKQPKLGSVKTWLRALVCARTEKNNDTSLEPVVVKYSVQFITDTLCVTKINKQR